MRRGWCGARDAAFRRRRPKGCTPSACSRTEEGGAGLGLVARDGSGPAHQAGLARVFSFCCLFFFLLKKTGRERGKRKRKVGFRNFGDNFIK